MTDEPLPQHALDKLLAVAAGATTRTSRPPSLHRLPDRYELLRELGRGGMGIVFEAFDRQLGRHCALKVIHGAASADGELRRRFVAEAQATARLSHPHIATVHDATADYLTMQRIDGGPIDAIPRAERHRIVALVHDAASAVHHAHEHGLVHRDLKPSNLLVEGDHVFVVDFGLAKELANDGRTASGAFVGTPAYMPPEQCRGDASAIDARSDVYALGATLHHCLTGSPPFVANDLPTLLRRIADEPPPSMRIDRDLDLVVAKCLAKDPAQRYPTAAAFGDDLSRWLRGEPISARRPSLRYRAGLALRRHRGRLRAAGVAAVVATFATALVLVPIALRESAAREAAGAAVAFAEHAATVMQDAAVFRQLGDLPSAHAALDSGIDAARAFLERHEVPRVRHVLARLLRDRGRPDEARRELERAIDGDADLAEARFELGVMLAAQPTLDDVERRTAIAALSTPLRVRSVLTNVDVLFGRAQAHRLRGEWHDAIAILHEVLAYDPTHVAARTSLSHAALALGDHDLARHYSVSAVDLQQGYGPAYLAREMRLLPTQILGLEGYLVDFAAHVEHGPDNGVAIAHRGLVHLRRSLRLQREGDVDEALAAVVAAIEDHDVTLTLHAELAGAANNRAVCWLRADQLHLARGDSGAAFNARTQAAADLARAVAAAPESPEVHGNVALLSLRKAELLTVLGRGAAADRERIRAREAILDALRLAPPDWPHRRDLRARLAAVSGQASRGGG